VELRLAEGDELQARDEFSGAHHLNLYTIVASYVELQYQFASISWLINIGELLLRRE